MSGGFLLVNFNGLPIMFYGLVWGKLFKMDDTLDHQNVSGLASIDFKFSVDYFNM